MTLWRATLALSACLILSGCYLMSDAPRFNDAQAVALLGNETATFAHFERDGSGWKRSTQPLILLVPEGNHYLMHDPTQTDPEAIDPPVHFVPLDEGHWVIQLALPSGDQGAQTYYAVATWDGAELQFRAISCDDLRDRPGITDLVSFTEDNCSLPPPAPGAKPEFPALLWRDLPPPDTKLVLQP